MSRLDDRRRLLALAGSALFALGPGRAAIAAGGRGLLMGLHNKASSVVPASAFFNGQAKIASNAVTGQTQLAGMPSSSSRSANIAKTLWFDQQPSSPMRFFTTSDPSSGFEYLTLDLYPAGTSMSVFNAATQRFDRTAYGLPSFVLRAFSASVALAFVVALNRFPLGQWWEILLLLNDASTAGASVLKAWQFVKGEAQNSSNVQSVQIGFANVPGGQPAQPITTTSQFPIFTGQSGLGGQATITIGGVPNATGQNSVTNVVMGSVFYSTQPAVVGTALASAAPGPAGFFTRPGFGAPGFFNSAAGVSTVATMGEVAPDPNTIGWLDNTGIQNVLLPNGNWATLPTMFGDVGSQPVEPADTLYYADPYF